MGWFNTTKKYLIGLYNHSMPTETYICVDVETSGPIPAQYAMLSIGACLVDDPATTFYRELRPDRPGSLPEALAISGLSLEELQANGSDPHLVMQAFADWIQRVVPPGNRAVFVALNAPFDWMFVHDYFLRYIGHDPFGHSALDIKAYYMGFLGVNWSETSMKQISAFLLQEKHLLHNALRDAQDQAEIFRVLLNLAQEENRANRADASADGHQ